MTGSQHPFDQSNAFLSEVPAQLQTAVMASPDGSQRLAVTVRTASTTVTVFLKKGDGLNWGANITGAAEGMSSLEIAQPHQVPPLNGHR